MRFLYGLLIGILSIQCDHAQRFHGCRFVRTFYRTHSNIFELNEDQTSLTIRPLYALTNQSFSILSIGIIYPLADVYLVPVPLLFQCSDSETIVTPIDCEFTIGGSHSDASSRMAESTRTATVPLHFQEYSSLKSLPIRGAYFKQSTIALRNCRMSTEGNLLISETFQLRVEFEQTINSSCQHTCIHPQLYQCSSHSNTCQCRSHETGIERFGQYCIDTELGSNCSRTPERCRRICRISDQLHTNRTDHHCQCPLDTQRILSNNMYHCDLPLSECNNDKRSTSCLRGYICRQQRCVQVSVLARVNDSILSLPFVLMGLLFGALLIIIILVISLIKMRSIRCVQFVHSNVLSAHSSPTIITRLSSSSSTLSSTNKTYEKYTKMNFLE